MRVLVLVLLVACATRRIELRAGGTATAIPRFGIVQAAALPDGRVVVAAHDRSIKCLSPDGEVAWSIATPGDGEPPRIAVGDDGGTWVLARTRADSTELIRIDVHGRVMRGLVVEAKAIPLFVTASPEGDAIAVIGTWQGLTVARVGVDGVNRYVRRLARGAERAPSTLAIPIVGALHGSTLWVAGAGTSLFVRGEVGIDVRAEAISADGTYHGPVVVSLDVASGSARVFPLEVRLGAPGSWQYPSGLAYADGQLVLARNGRNETRVTVHDPRTLVEARQIYGLAGGEVHALTADRDHVIAAISQNAVATARRIPVAGGNATVVAALRSVPRGHVTMTAPVVWPRVIGVLGSFRKTLRVGSDGSLDGNEGETAFVIRAPR